MQVILNKLAKISRRSSSAFDRARTVYTQSGAPHKPARAKDKRAPETKQPSARQACPHSRLITGY